LGAPASGPARCQFEPKQTKETKEKIFVICVLGVSALTAFPFGGGLANTSIKAEK
jgi:hypothetical protein